MGYLPLRAASTPGSTAGSPFFAEILSQLTLSVLRPIELQPAVGEAPVYSAVKPVFDLAMSGRDVVLVAGNALALLDTRARPDSADVTRPEIAPDEQIRVLRLLRLQVQEAKRQFLDRAATFEDRVRRIG